MEFLGYNMWTSVRTGITVISLATQADSGNSICIGDTCWGASLRRKDRASWLANCDLSSVLIIR